MVYDESTAQGVLDETITNGWLDRQTRAVILEFAVFNVNTNLISVATYFYEALATGAAYTTRRIETLELYSTESGALMFFLICQFLFMAMVLLYSYVSSPLSTTRRFLQVSLEHGGFLHDNFLCSLCSILHDQS